MVVVLHRFDDVVLEKPDGLEHFSQNSNKQRTDALLMRFPATESYFIASLSALWRWAGPCRPVRPNS